MIQAQQIVDLITQEIQQAREDVPNAQEIINTCEDWHTQQSKRRYNQYG
jgi:hypothetical protein